MENHHDMHTDPASWKDYIPLIVIVGYCLLLALVHKESFMYGFISHAVKPLHS